MPRWCAVPNPENREVTQPTRVGQKLVPALQQTRYVVTCGGHSRTTSATSAATSSPRLPKKFQPSSSRRNRFIFRK